MKSQSSGEAEVGEAEVMEEPLRNRLPKRWFMPRRSEYSTENWRLERRVSARVFASTDVGVWNKEYVVNDHTACSVKGVSCPREN